MELDLESFDPAILIEEVIATVKPLVQKNFNQLEVYSSDNLGLMFADVTKTRQILFNLLSNAAKFTENGKITFMIWKEEKVVRPGLTLHDHSSSLKFSAPPETFVSDSSPTSTSAMMYFRVADTGIGLSMKQLQQLFQAFTQGDASTTRKYGGTGLGLAISRHFCHRMGGDIEVESELGLGSIFTVKLPVNVAQQSIVNESTQSVS